MPDFGLAQSNVSEAAGASTSTSAGVVVTCSASANVKGAYAQLIAATTYPTAWVMITIALTSAGGRYLVDLAVGGAGSEQVVIANLAFQPRSTALGMPSTFLLPLALPAGVRLSARGQCSTSSSRTATVAVHLFAGTMTGSAGLGAVESGGPDTTDSGLTSVDPGGTAHTKGAYVQMVAATLYPWKWLCITLGGNGLSVSAITEWLLDVAVGAAASEQVVVPNLWIPESSGGGQPPQSICIPVWIPAGSRVSVRVQCNVNTATERLLDVALYGVS